MKNVTIKLSEIQIIPKKPDDGHLGWVSFVINNQFYVGNIAIYSRFNGGLRLVYPQTQLANGKIISSFHPINKETGQFIQDKVSSAYNENVRNRHERQEKN